jgi:hypothetical protein
MLISLLEDYDEAAEKARALAFKNAVLGYHRLYAALHTRVAKHAKSWGYGCCTAAKTCPDRGDSQVGQSPP